MFTLSLNWNVFLIFLEQSLVRLVISLFSSMPGHYNDCMELLEIEGFFKSLH